jgi:hypothetical protein
MCRFLKKYSLRFISKSGYIFVAKYVFLFTDDKRAQDAMTRALVDLNTKMVTQLKKKQTSKNMRKSPVHYDIPTATPVSRPTPSLSAISAKTNVTVEG